jgi:hypothetical protein
MRAFFSLSAVAILFLPVLASADSFDWTFGGGADSMIASGTLDAIADGSGNYEIIDGTGTLGNTDGSGLNYSVTFLSDPAGCTYPDVCVKTDLGSANLTYDNVLVDGTSLDYAGGVILTSTDPGSGNPVYFNIWGNSAGEFNDLSDGRGWNQNTNVVNGFAAVPATLSQAESAAPEPATLALAGFALAGFVVRRRFQKTTR